MRSRVRSRAEQFLVWALALASTRRWKQAGLFAQAAWQVADLEAAAARRRRWRGTKKPRDQADRTAQNAIGVRNEAALLRIEIRRLGARGVTDPDNDVPDPTRRYTLAMAELNGLGDWRP